MTITQVIILLITTIELNVTASSFRITVTELVVEQNLLRFITLIIIQLSILVLFKITSKIFRYADAYTFWIGLQ